MRFTFYRAAQINISGEMQIRLEVDFFFVIIMFAGELTKTEKKNLCLIKISLLLLPMARVHIRLLPDYQV